MLVNWLCSELCPVHPCTHSSPAVMPRRSSSPSMPGSHVRGKMLPSVS